MASATQKEDSEKGPVKGTPAAEPSLNMDELRELAKLVDEHGFTDFEFENEKIRVRLGKSTIVHHAAPVAPAHPAPYEAPAAQPAAQAAESAPEADEDDGLHKITSPIVGTFYRAPSPEKPPYVKEGDTVSPDSVVCIVEAMKLMNEIQAEISGEIVKVYVANAQPVEFGQPLFGIKK
ncbi:MAG: acetyl-CoA carboxylase biotin carboxyl carrier protein [Aridibacter famidurans]|nr:acetyl-CoA carboxylase biotin carboxyl carrier protein [Aridibacter famidurans]